MRPGRNAVASALCLAAVFAAGLALKAHASGADAEQLRWMLAPTTRLVQWATGVHFEDEGSAGFLSRERRFAIVPACAGVSFLVVALWTLAFGFVRAGAAPARNLGVVGLAAAGAYGATLVTNAARIALAMALHARGGTLAGLSPASLHRVQGVLVYLVALCAVFWLASRFAGRPVRLAIPLGCYLAVTLLLPLLNGAAEGAAFWRHAAVVVTGVAGVWLVFRLVKAASARGSPRFER